MKTFYSRRAIVFVGFLLPIFAMTYFVATAFAQEATGTVDTEELAFVFESDNVVQDPAPTPVEDLDTDEEVPDAVSEEVLSSSTTETVVEEELPQQESSEEVVEESEVSLESTTIETQEFTPELSTDKDDYHPGDTATIFGRFFAPLQSLILKVFGSDENNQNYTESQEEITTDEDGSFSFEYVLDSLYRPFYEVVVSTLEGEKVAETWFRDAAVDIYNQCSNDDGDGYANGDTECRFINGAINASNSTYQEGDSTIQRLAISGFAPGSHNVTFTYGTTKAGKHAYDYLTTWDASESWSSVIDRCDGVSGCTSASETTLDIPQDPNVPNAFEPNAPGDRQFVMRGATLTSATTPTLVSGSYGGGDTETQITVHFTVPSSGPMCSTKKVQGQDVTSCSVILWFGAHIALGTDWTPVDGFGGAGTINGSPYHVALSALDGSSVGSRDNQMQADAIEPAPGEIIVIKQTIPDGNTTDFTFDPSWSASNFTLSDGEQQSSGELVSGVYSVSEALPAGWDQTSATCSDGSPVGAIALAAGEVVTCTFTNTLQTGHIVVNKVTNPEADPESFAFTTIGSGYSSFSLTDAATPNDQELVAGAYSVSEEAESGWTLIDTSCVSSHGDTETAANLELDAGETITCTFTNGKIPTLTLIKNVVNDNGGTATAAAFQAKIDGNNVPWGAAQASTVGVHTASETTLPTYTAGDWGGDCDDDGSVTLAYGDAKTCSITNDDKQAYITVVKEVTNDNGGEAGPNDFALTLEGNPVSSGVAVPVNPGTYTAGETLVSGYSFVGFSGDCNSDGDVTVALGESKTCTLTNNDQPGHLIVHKVTNPALDPTVFSVTLNATPVSGSATQDISTTASVDYTVHAGEYSVSEEAESGWKETGNTCVDVEVGIGETKECTITNTKLAKITIVKDAINNNAQDFSFTNDFGNGNPANFLLDDDAQATLPNTRTFEVMPGTFSVSETSVDGWQQESATCTDGSSVAAIAVTAGEEVTCTFVNEQYATIVLVKNTVGGEGMFDFTLTGEGLPATEQLTTDGNTASETYVDLDQDLTYSIAETVPTGWALVSAGCSGTNTPEEITPNPGETVTCTFTNGKLPTLTLQKTVELNDGGNEDESDFTPFINGATTTWDTTVTLTPNTYTASESNLPGYEAGDWGGDCAANGEIELAYGDEAVCSIVNDDIAPTITLIKALDIQYGGTASIGDFELTVGGDAVLSGDANPVSANTPYALDEVAIDGYAFKEITGDAQCPEVLGGEVTLNEGDNLTCTIVNKDLPNKISGYKFSDENNNSVWDDGEPALPGWTINLNGDEDTTVTDVNGYYEFTELPAGEYVVSETQQGGWSQTFPDGDGTHVIPLGNGEELTLNFGNVELGTIIIAKQLVSVNEDSADVAFSFASDFDGAFTLVGGATNATANLLPGDYEVSETPTDGFDLTLLSCDGENSEVDVEIGVASIVLEAGETVTCTYTNTERGHLIVQKTTDPVADATLFTIAATGDGTITGGGAGTVTDALDEDYEVTPGTYSVSETVPAGWQEVSNSCTDVVVAAGETKTCEIVNQKLSKLTIIKDATPNDLIDFAFTAGTLGGFTLDDDTGVADKGLFGDTDRDQSKVFTDVVPASYTISETQPNQYWKIQSVSCVENGGGVYPATVGANLVTVDLTAGKDVICTFVNEKVSPTRTQGFWQTHTAYTTQKFTQLFGTGMTIGNAVRKTILTKEQLFGAWYSSVPKKTDNKQRTALDKARMQLLQQLVTAKLNCAAFTCLPSVQTLIANAETAYSGTSASAILTAAGQLDTYNNSGDTLVIGNAGKATPKDSQNLANKVFWNAP